MLKLLYISQKLSRPFTYDEDFHIDISSGVSLRLLVLEGGGLLLC